MAAHPHDLAYGRFHNAWRSVRMFEPANCTDNRANLDFTQLTKEDQALCVVTGITVEDALQKHVLDGGVVDGAFVRRTMEDIYDAYNRFTFAMNGLNKYGLDWFGVQKDDGPESITEVAAYDSLSFSTKEIDRRMVMVGALALPVEFSHVPGITHAQRDGNAIEKAIAIGIPYDLNNAYAIEASYNEFANSSHK